MIAASSTASQVDMMKKMDQAAKFALYASKSEELMKLMLSNSSTDSFIDNVVRENSVKLKEWDELLSRTEHQDINTLSMEDMEKHYDLRKDLHVNLAFIAKLLKYHMKYRESQKAALAEGSNTDELLTSMMSGSN
jgi:hypothetical protein